MVIASPAGAYFARGVKPVSIMVSEHYTRAAVGGLGAAKTGGNYASSLAPQSEAIERGFDQVVFLDAIERRYVEELGGMNLYFVHDDGTIVTPELTGTILEGVTRSSIIDLAGSLGPQGGGAALLDRRVARRRHLGPDHRGLRVRYGGRGHPGRRAVLERGRGRLQPRR